MKNYINIKSLLTSHYFIAFCNNNYYLKSSKVTRIRSKIKVISQQGRCFLYRYKQNNNRSFK